MKKIILKILLAILFVTLLLFLVISAIIYILQPYVFFYPKHDDLCYTFLKGTDGFKEITINGENKLNGWLKYNTEKNPAPLLIYLGGNSQNASSTFYNFYNNNIFNYFENYNVLYVDYPGYGFSSGNPSEKSLFEAALNIYDYAYNLDFVDKNNIVIFGYSIGTGPATYLASQRDVNGLILLAPYDNALSLYNYNINIFYGPLKLLARYKFTSDVYAQNVNVAPLIITSYSDEVINYEFSLNLASYFKEVYDTIVLDNIRHSYYFENTDVLNNISLYLQYCLN